MPVKIEARLIHRSVFFTGETVHCQVAFTYVDQSEMQGNSENIDHVTRTFEHNHVGSNSIKSMQEDVTIAWASAQIYCQCHINESRVVSTNNIKGQHNLPADVVTSFIPTRGETGHCFLSTKPEILLCNLKLKKGQTKIVSYAEDIPSNAPPSYKGQAVRFSYKITIGIGSIQGPTKLIRLPIRVVSTEGLLIENQRPTFTCDARNPFIEDAEEEDHSLSDIVVDRLTFLTSQRNANIYNISCNQGCAGKFSLSKSYYRIGEDLQGTFDFTDATVKCMKYKVSLQSEEEVMESFRKTGNKQKILHTTYSRCEECCLNCRQTNFCLPIPITATPEFTSNLVSVRWRLHCEVTTAAQDESDDPGERNEDSKKSSMLENGLRKDLQNSIVPKNIKIETMTWDIPVRILASNPNQISFMSSSQLSVNVIL